MPDPSIKDPNYIERPEAPELDLISRLHGRFKGTGLVMPKKQREMYEALSAHFLSDISKGAHFPKFIYRKTVVDVGCGVGIGTNILGRETKFAWGIDTNAESISYAKQMFERMPNNLYTTAQVTFDVVDVTNFNRETMKFDYVTAIEIIEHLSDHNSLLTFLDRLTGPNTTVFISTPNRNAPEIQKDTPRNPFHVREHTAAEFYDILIQHYKSVTLWSYDMKARVDLDTEITPVLAECSGVL